MQCQGLSPQFFLKASEISTGNHLPSTSCAAYGTEMPSYVIARYKYRRELKKKGVLLLICLLLVWHQQLPN